MGAKLRLLAVGVVAAAAAAGIAWLPWFVVKARGSLDPSMPDVSVTMALKLRGAEVCVPGGCQTATWDKFGGGYPWLSTVALWTGVAFLLGLIVRTVTEHVRGGPEPLFTTLARIAGPIALCAGLAVLFLAGPDTGRMVSQHGSLSIRYGLGGWFAIPALLVGNVLAYLSTYDLDAIGNLPRAAAPSAPAPYPPGGPPAARYAPPTAGTGGHTLAPAAPGLPPTSIGAAAPAPAPPALPRFAATVAHLAPDGVHGRRGDGPRAVAWEAVVGVIVRRGPDGAPFVDLVSTADATLRFGAWTALTGDLVDGADPRDPLATARALARHLAARCPAARLDGATRAFIDGAAAEPPALADAAAQAAYDDRLG